MTEEESDLRLEASIAGLAERVPGVSARRILSSGQRKWGLIVIAAFLIGCLIDWW
jgi:hypothetical protein